MTFKLSLGAGVVALMLAMTGAAPSMAADDESGQKPPAEQKPVEDKKCVSTDTRYVKAGNGSTFRITLKNDCEQRLRCTVRAYHVDSSGPHTGKGTLTLGPKSKGAQASKDFVMKVGDMGGSANISHACKTI